MASIFGYTIDSRLRFTFLREGRAGSVLRVAEANDIEQPRSPALLEWAARPDHPHGARLYQTGSRFTLWIDDAGWYQTDIRRSRITVSPAGEPVRREASLWSIPTALCFIERGDLALHAAAVDVDGSALLLAAAGRTGKTTLACGFHAAGFRVLSEDISCCRPSTPPELLPGAAMLRVRRDTFEHLELRDTRVVASDPERVILAIDSSLRGDGLPMPIRGIVLLESSTAPFAIERVALPGALRALWSLSFKLPTDADRARCFQALGVLGSAVPIWRLRWPRDFRSLPAVVKGIVSACSS